MPELIAYLSEELPYVWRDQYLADSKLPSNIMMVTHGSFEYIFDDYQTLENTGQTPYHPTAMSRLVAVHGHSDPKARKRDDGRLKRWIGPTNTVYGHQWDKGHFIAHTMGGAVDGVEANVFIQRRDLNRGWSKEGARYREMEKYCVAHPGTYCFSRPVYADETSRPAFVEFGVLRSAGDLWVERFSNRI